MEKQLYAIEDIKAEIFETPITFGTDGEATRQFCDLLKDERFKYHKHPIDYRLMCVGAMSMSTGIIKPRNAPRLVTEGKHNILEKEKINANSNT